MRFAILTVLATTLLAGVGLAANPQYMKPTNTYVTGTSSTKCGNSTFNILSGQGDILPEDCHTIMADWNNKPFTVVASDWVNSTGDADHFLIYATEGTCQFAFKRTDGVDDTVFLGDVDLKAVVNGSLNANGGAELMQSVEGVFGCESQQGRVAVVEWTVRKAPNASPPGRATM